MRPPLKPEQVIGKYRVIRLIAMGGMGAVYEVLHTELERRDALKVMLPEFASRSELRARFIREAKVTNRVRHPGIVQIYEISALPDGSPYFVMEYIEGETLSQRMHQLEQAAGSRRGAADLAPLRQVASILASCHAKGLIHRDLKPSNIMLVKDPDVAGGERVKLLDFGIVKIQDEPAKTPKAVTEPQTQAGLLLGTPEYMAPEQWGTGAPLTEKVDVYALGIMAYRILGGRLPFIGDSPLAFGVLHVSTEPRPLRELAPDLPGEVYTLVDQMLAKNARMRPSISEVVSTLDRIVGLPRSSEVRSGQLIIPDSFSSGSEPVPPALLPSGAKAPPRAQAGKAQKRSSGPIAKPSPPSVDAPFVPSHRPASPDSTTARGHEPPHRTISLDFASLTPPANADKQPAPSAVPADLKIPSSVDMSSPSSEGKPPRRLGLWLGAAGLVPVAGLLLLIGLRNPGGSGQGKTPTDSMAADMVIVASASDAAPEAPRQSDPSDMDSAPELRDSEADLRTVPDMLSPLDLAKSNGPKPPIKPPVVTNRAVPRKVGLSCISNKDIPGEQQKLIIDGFKQSGVLLTPGTNAVPGDLVVVVNKDGRPHVEQIPTFLLDRRELLEYALRGLFPKGFPAQVVIRCPVLE